VTFVAVGTCSLTAHVANGTNYTAANGSAQTFNIGQGTPTTPTISNLPGSATVGGNFTPTVTTNGDGVTSVTDNSTAYCTLSGGVVTFVAVGTCSLTAHVANGTNYTAANGSAQTFNIGVSVVHILMYTVDFDSQGGTSVSSIRAAAGVGISLPSPPVLSGATFEGWYLAPSGGQALTSPYIPSGSVTLYAQWSVVTQVLASVPAAPTIRAASTSSRSVVVTLVRVPSSDGSPIIGYVYSLGGSWQSVKFNAHGQATIHHLSSGTFVLVSVRAINNVGTGPRSRPVRVKVR